MLAQAGRDADVLVDLLFGSVAPGEQTARSELDICLVLMPPSTPDVNTSPLRERMEYLAQFDLDVQIFQALLLLQLLRSVPPAGHSVRHPVLPASPPYLS
jgi:predicted nucleotidyltransferase